MRIVYVSSLPKGGPVAHLRTLAPAVARTGADVHVICGDDEVARSLRARGVDASVVPLRHKADLPGARRVRRLIAGADIVHTHDRRAGLLIRPASRIGGARAIHTYHGLPEEIAGRLGRDDAAPAPPGTSRARVAWLLYGYLRLEALLSLFGAVVVPSHAMARFLTARGMPAGRVHVIPHGIDVPPDEPSGGRSSDGATVVGTAANLQYEKGVDLLVAACTLVTGTIRLVILGDGPWRGRLEKRAAESGLDAHFLGHVDNVRERLAALDVFVLPSRAENFPIAALEAMAAGLPVVATRVGGVPELVVDGETGLIVEPDDQAALAGAIDSLAADASRRQALGTAGARRVADVFDADRMAARMLALYDSLA